jgi:hypothetical protein
MQLRGPHGSILIVLFHHGSSTCLKARRKNHNSSELCALYRSFTCQMLHEIIVQFYLKDLLLLSMKLKVVSFLVSVSLHSVLLEQFSYMTGSTKNWMNSQSSSVIRIEASTLVFDLAVHQLFPILKVSPQPILGNKCA